MIIAIDGPAGSGKSSTARAVAQRLGFRHLDSGAFYRALTYAAQRAGIPVEQWDALTAAQLDTLDVHAVVDGERYRMHLGDDDVSAAIRTPEVTAHVSAMARVPAVREWLLERLREAGRNGDLVADGRDIGTVVFPDADLKVFLIADARVRAHRRLLQMSVPIDDVAIDDEARRIEERDHIDSSREVAPLVAADDAVELDTTKLDFEAQVEAIVALAEGRR